MIERQYLTIHVETGCPCRKVNCQYCHDTGEHQFIESQHKEECPKLPLPCPNNCKVGTVLREDMDTHRKECPLEMIQCEYYAMGCAVKMAHRDQEKHYDEKMKEHLIMTTCKLYAKQKHPGCKKARPIRSSSYLTTDVYVHSYTCD